MTSNPAAVTRPSEHQHRMDRLDLYGGVCKCGARTVDNGNTWTEYPRPSEQEVKEAVERLRVVCDVENEPFLRLVGGKRVFIMTIEQGRTVLSELERMREAAPVCAVCTQSLPHGGWFSAEYVTRLRAALRSAPRFTQEDVKLCTTAAQREPILKRGDALFDLADRIASTLTEKPDA